MMHAYYKLGWSQRSSCALALATRQSWQRPHLQGMSVAKARQTRRSLLGCKYWNMVLWSGSGRGCFVYPALMRRSLNGTHRRTSTALFFGGPTPFLLALSKEMGSGKYVPKCKALGKALKDAVLETVKGGAFAVALEMGSGKTHPQRRQPLDAPKDAVLATRQIF